MKKYLVLVIGLGLLVSGFLALNFARIAYAAGDCDGNSVIYCGVKSRTELISKVSNGTGKQYQSGNELKALFAKYNAYPSEFYSLKVGKVTDDNKVYVDGKLVAAGVYTMGRHNIQPGSSKISGLAYPLYRRHPSVSFNSKELEAYVYLNYDGSMRYAVIKSCGNIVIGVVKEAPVPPVVPPTPTPEKANLIIRKYNDANGNAVQDTGEVMLAGWQFRVVGPGLNQTVSTLTNGTVTLTGLTPASYTVTEVLQTGWTNTTGLSITRSVTTNAATQTFNFGNKENVTPLTPSVPAGGGEVLPVTGTREWVMAGLVLVLLGAGLWWYRSKDMLRLAKRRKPTGAIKSKKRRVVRRKK